MLFLSDQRDWRATMSPPPPMFSKIIRSKFWDTILFIIFKRPSNYVLGYNINTHPTSPGEMSLSYKICPLFTHSIFYWELCIDFGWGVGTNFLLGVFPQRDFLRGGKFPGDEFVWRYFTLGKFARIPIQNYFYLSCYFFRLSFTCGVVKGDYPG